MYHWDLPQKLQDMGGWMNASVIQYMEDYADLLFCLYGNKVTIPTRFLLLDTNAM